MTRTTHCGGGGTIGSANANFFPSHLINIAYPNELKTKQLDDIVIVHNRKENTWHCKNCAFFAPSMALTKSFTSLPIDVKLTQLLQLSLR